MKRSITSILILGFLFLILTWSPAYAAKQVATVVAARGDVQALDAKGKNRTLAIQAPIFEEDTIKTREHSRVQIMFTDNTLINLGNETTMKIAEYRWQPEQNDGALKTQIKEGTFRVMGGALTKTAPQNFKTETPTATIGIRGSMYAGVVTPNFLSVVFQGGKGIDVTNALGTVAITKPGYGTKVTLDKPPLPPVKFTAQEMGELNKALSGNGEKKEEKKEEDKGKKDDKGQEKGPAPKEGQGAAQPPAEQPAAAAPASAPADTTPLSNLETMAIDPVVEPAPALAPATVTTTPLVPLVPDLAKDVVANTSQTTLVTTISDTTATTEITNTALNGNYRFILRDIDLTLPDPDQFNATFLVYDAGTVAATLTGTGEISGTLSNSMSFGPYPIPGYDPNATSYTGYNTFTDAITYPDPTLGTLSLMVTTVGEPSGQFFYNTFYYTIDSIAPDPDILVAQLLYAGIPSTSIPTAGIDTYTGHLVFNNTSGSFPDAGMEKTSIAVNWHNGRLIGRSYEITNPNKYDGAVFFGSMAADGTAVNVIILGGDGDPNGPDISTSSGLASARLYGNFNQGLGFTGSGADYTIISNLQTNTWEVTGAALREPGTTIVSPYPTSPIAYTGFVVGAADNTANGLVSRIFMNNAASDFSMSVDPTSGTLSGTLDAAELSGLGGISLAGVAIGNPMGFSAYVANNDMVATLSGSNLALNPVIDSGNFLVTAGPEAPIITNFATDDFMTWGYWQMSYIDPYDSSTDHLFAKQSFFVAGQQTSPAYITSILNTPFTGVYEGKAFGVQLDTGGLNTELTNGLSQLTINFQNPSAANAVTGSISFDQATMNINSAAGALTNTGFNAGVATVSGTAPLSSQVNGTFFGPAAQAVGGNFHALMPGGTQFIGIFGGSQIPQ